MSRVGHIARHRAVVAAILTLCAGFALSACRTDPGVAAYVGSDTLSEDDVTQTIDNTKENAPEGSQPPTRETVVTTFVLTKVCEKLRAEKSFALVPVTAEQVAQAEGTPAAAQYTQDRAAMYSCISGVDVGEAGEPSDAELRDLFARAQAAGVVNGTYDEIKGQLAADPSIRQAITVSRTLTAMVDAGDVSVNPRYRPLEFTIADFDTGTPLIVVPVGEAGSDAVRDLTVE